MSQPPSRPVPVYIPPNPQGSPHPPLAQPPKPNLYVNFGGPASPFPPSNYVPTLPINNAQIPLQINQHVQTFPFLPLNPPQGAYPIPSPNTRFMDPTFQPPLQYLPFGPNRMHPPVVPQSTQSPAPLNPSASSSSSSSSSSSQPMQIPNRSIIFLY